MYGCEVEKICKFQKWGNETSVQIPTSSFRQSTHLNSIWVIFENEFQKCSLWILLFSSGGKCFLRRVRWIFNKVEWGDKCEKVHYIEMEDKEEKECSTLKIASTTERNILYCLVYSTYLCKLRRKCLCGSKAMFLLWQSMWIWFMDQRVSGWKMRKWNLEGDFVVIISLNFLINPCIFTHIFHSFENY